MKKFAFIFFILLLSTFCQARIIYVDFNTPNNGGGSDWANAYKYFQDALIEANSNLDVNEIWIAEGVYRPDETTAFPDGSGDRKATFRLINDVAIYGGFPTGGGNWEDRDPNIYQTILSGDLNGNDGPGFTNYEENSFHVINGSGTNDDFSKVFKTVEEVEKFLCDGEVNIDEFEHVEVFKAVPLNFAIKVKVIL